MFDTVFVEIQFLWAIFWDVITSQKYLTQLNLWEFYQPVVDLLGHRLRFNPKVIVVCSDGESWKYTLWVEGHLINFTVPGEIIKEIFVQVNELVYLIKLETVILSVGLLFFLVLVQNKRKA